MRIVVTLDKARLSRAMQMTGARSKSQVIDIALRRLVGDDLKPIEAPNGRLDYSEILSLFGKDMIDPDYDPKSPSAKSSKRRDD